MVALLRKQLEAMDRPTPGLPMAERDKAIKVLDAKLAKLRAREAELIETAEKAGLIVS